MLFSGLIMCDLVSFLFFLISIGIDVGSLFDLDFYFFMVIDYLVVD